MKNRANQKLKVQALDSTRPSAQRVQIGGRLPVTMNTCLQLSAVLSPYSKDQILEDAVAIYYGTADEAAYERQKAVLAKVSELREGKVPFEFPLTPNKNNAVLTSRGASNKLTFRFSKRMGS